MGGTPVAASTLEILRRRQGGGRALPEALVAPISEQLNVDLSNVRVHADAEAAKVSGSLQATAFTHGSDLYFAEGAYRPDSAAGKHLLAHELAHVAQNASAGGSPGSALMVGRADDPMEVQAEATAHSVLQHLRRSTDRANRPGPPGSELTMSNTAGPEPSAPPAHTDQGTAKTKLSPHFHSSTLVVRRYEASGKQKRELTARMKFWWKVDGDDLTYELDRVTDWCSTHADAMKLVATLTSEQFDTACGAYKDSAEAVLAKGSFEGVRDSGPDASAPSLAGRTKDAKPKDEYKKARKLLRDLKFDGAVSEDDLATITTAAGQHGQGWDSAVTNFIITRREAQNAAALSNARTVKYAPAKMVGDGLFQQGLVKTVWDAAYGLAVNGASSANPMLTLGAAYDREVILAAVQLWRNNKSSLVANLVENLHVPGGESPIEHKGRREDNPDPARGQQADFISVWAGTVINVHVDVKNT